MKKDIQLSLMITPVMEQVKASLVKRAHIKLLMLFINI